MQKEIKNMSEESKRKGRITPTEQWWVGGMLLNYRENDCLDTSWYEYMTGWEEWLSEDHKKEKRQQLKASHDKFVEKVVINGGGGAGFKHMVTQPTLWRGGIQVLEGFTWCGSAEESTRNQTCMEQPLADWHGGAEA